MTEYTLEKLPVVGEDTANAVYEELEGFADNLADFASKYIERVISDENYQVGNFVVNFFKTASRDPLEFQSAMMAASMVYALLKKEGEAGRLEIALNGPEE